MGVAAAFCVNCFPSLGGFWLNSCGNSCCHITCCQAAPSTGHLPTGAGACLGVAQPGGEGHTQSRRAQEAVRGATLCPRFKNRRQNRTGKKDNPELSSRPA